MTESPFKPLSAYEERDAEWLIPGWIPKGSIGTLASDGGIGKTSVWCSLVADISAGRPCFLDPPNHHREPETVAFLSAEDSVQAKLARKIRLAGGDMSRILTPDLMRDAGQLMQRMKFGSSELVSFIKAVKPGIVVFDPLQGFVPPEVNMSARNAMRNCLAPLTALGEETGTSFLIVAHSNKRKGAWGRDRIADSADLWDISRSVLMAGIANESGQRYLSQEKSNYGILQKTVLFSVGDEGQIIPMGTTWKRDRDFMVEAAQGTKTAKEDCRGKC